jgi:glyoxylase-like metal-dependent hydrolase (beta-lactamase superfamily II)
VSGVDWWWSPHPSWRPGEDWDENVPVVRIETDGEVVLIDPFLPPDDSFDPGGRPVRVLLTQGAHYRGTADFVARYGASVWGPPKAWRPPKRPNPSTTDELPDGIEALELDGEPQQVMFWIPEHATLVTGDVISGTGVRVHVFVDDADEALLLPALERIAELPIERLIIPHGAVLEPDGARRLRAAIAETRGG